MSVSYKNATRCRTCNVLYLSSSESQMCEATHRKENSKLNIKNESSGAETDDDFQLDDDANNENEGDEKPQPGKGYLHGSGHSQPRMKGPRGGFRAALWNSESSEKLIRLVKKNYETILTGKCSDKKLVWDQITKKMQDMVPGLNDEQIKGKWTNIRYNVVKYVERPDKGKIRRPEHMDLLLSFLQDKSLFGLTNNSTYSDEEEEEQISLTSSRHKRRRRSTNVQDDDRDVDTVYSVLCQEISEPSTQDDDSEYVSYKKQKLKNNSNSSSNTEILLQDIAKQLRLLNERDKEFKQFIKKSFKNFEERQLAREDREVAREEREIAREEREQARHKTEVEKKESIER